MSSLAQNWSLVMPNDTLVYVKGERMLHTVWIKSINISPTDTVYSINQVSPGEYVSYTNLCSSFPGMSSWSNSSQYMAIQSQFYGSRITKSQNKWVVNVGAKEIVVYPTLPVNSTWIFDSTTFDTATLSSISYEYLDGYEVSDSVKTIDMGIYQLRVSKNFGIVKMNDFRDTAVYTNSTFKLIGVQNLQKGTVIPMGLTFFEFSLGDRFSYHEYAGDSDIYQEWYWYEEVVAKHGK